MQRVGLWLSGFCIFLILFVAQCEQKKEAPPSATDPRYRLTLPQEGAWVVYRTTEYSGGFVSAWRSVFIAQGAYWRIELEKHRGPVTVAVYDGQRLSLSRKADLKPEDLNRLVFYRLVYQSLQEQFVFDADEEVNGYACWRFIGSGGSEAHSMLWVEQKGQMVRKAFTRAASGENVTEEFFDLPAGITRPAKLFDPENLNPLFITQLKSWKIK